MAVEDYLRMEKLPHIWCPGCGHGIVMGAITRAIEKNGWDKNKVVVVSGIGCSSRAPGYMDFDTLHTLHGRAIPFAAGVKMANPELHVIVITGDGDGAAIGGNHLIHACRRNVGLNIVLLNNSIYGMTSGQYSPLTPEGALATTSPYGNIDPAFDLCNLAMGSGANFVARGTAYHIHKLIDYISKGFENPGFSFIEAISQCPTNFGRRNKQRTGLEMMKWQRDNSVDFKKAQTMSAEELKGKFITGIFCDREDKEYTEKYRQLVEQFQEGSN